MEERKRRGGVGLRVGGLERGGGNIENVNFTDNDANTNGGAIVYTLSVDLLISQLLIASFSKNNASSGGAIITTSGFNSSLEKVNFTDNALLRLMVVQFIYTSSTNQSIAGSTF